MHPTFTAALFTIAKIWKEATLVPSDIKYVCVCVYIYIYTYIYTHNICTYIQMYIYTEKIYINGHFKDNMHGPRGHYAK